MKRDACMEVLRAAIKKELLGKEIVETLPFPDLYNLARENKMLPLLVYVDYKQNIEETMERKENMEMLTSIIQGLKKRIGRLCFEDIIICKAPKKLHFIQECL